MSETGLYYHGDCAGSLAMVKTYGLLSAPTFD